MARVPENATTAQIKAAAKTVLSEEGHHLTDEQQRILRYRVPEAQAELLRHLDCVDGLNRSRLKILDGKDASLLYFLSKEEQRIISRRISYRSSRETVRTLLRVVKECRDHEHKLQDGATIVDLIGPLRERFERPERDRAPKPEKSYSRPWEEARKLVASGKEVSLGPQVIFQAKRPKETPKSDEKRPNGKKQKRRAVA